MESANTMVDKLQRRPAADALGSVQRIDVRQGSLVLTVALASVLTSASANQSERYASSTATIPLTIRNRGRQTKLTVQRLRTQIRHLSALWHEVWIGSNGYRAARHDPSPSSELKMDIGPDISVRFFDSHSSLPSLSRRSLGGSIPIS